MCNINEVVIDCLATMFYFSLFIYNHIASNVTILFPNLCQGHFIMGTFLDSSRNLIVIRKRRVVILYDKNNIDIKDTSSHEVNIDAHNVKRLECLIQWISRRLNVWCVYDECIATKVVDTLPSLSDRTQSKTVIYQLLVILSMTIAISKVRL